MSAVWRGIILFTGLILEIAGEAADFRLRLLVTRDLKCYACCLNLQAGHAASLAISKAAAVRPRAKTKRRKSSSSRTSGKRSVGSVTRAESKKRRVQPGAPRITSLHLASSPLPTDVLHAQPASRSFSHSIFADSVSASAGSFHYSKAACSNCCCSCPIGLPILAPVEPIS